MRTALLLLILFSLLLDGKAQDTKEVYKHIFFGGGSAYIDQKQARDLGDFVKTLKNLEYYDVSVIAHTDNIGGKEYNEWLSSMRSSAVVGLLKELGVSTEQIRFRNDGQRNPAFDNSTGLGRMRNRRVDVIFTPIVF